jgi:hypothetical protein
MSIKKNRSYYYFKDQKMSKVMKQVMIDSYRFVSSLNNATIRSNKGTAGLGLQSGWTRVTFIVKQDHAQKIKMHAKQHKITMKKVLHVILTQYLSAKTIDPIPSKLSQKVY